MNIGDIWFAQSVMGQASIGKSQEAGKQHALGLALMKLIALWLQVSQEEQEGLVQVKMNLLILESV
ncbi:TPA: hypothetical protein L6B58_26300 [Pseudomonas aeruginosa]|nr:hypothetical protein CJT74_29210 [Pseudomonas aeruginosa]HBP5737113.1 hypothetical protein [Pseudomonas aeruginosa]